MGEDFLNSVYKRKCEIQVKANNTAMSDMEAGVRQLLSVVLGHLKESCPVFEVAEIVPLGVFTKELKSEHRMSLILCLL